MNAKNLLRFLGLLFAALLLVVTFRITTANATTSAQAEGNTVAKSTVLAPGPYTRLSDGELIPTSIITPTKPSLFGMSTFSVQTVQSAPWKYWKTTYEGKVTAMGSLPEYIGYGVSLISGPVGIGLTVTYLVVNLSNQTWNKVNKEIIGTYELRKYYVYPDGDGVNIEYDSYFYKNSNYTDLVVTIKTDQVMQHIPLH